MKKIYLKIVNFLSNWWNKIDYIELYFFNSNNFIRIPRKYVSIGYETENVKILNLKDIKILSKNWFLNIKDIYPRLVLINPETWILYLHKIKIDYKNTGYFESDYVKIKSSFNLNFYLNMFNNQDINYIKCYGKWYRRLISLSKCKSYILVVPWNILELKNFNKINKEQAVSYRNLVNKDEFEIRWTKEAIKVFSINNEKYTTYKNLINKKKVIKNIFE